MQRCDFDYAKHYSELRPPDDLFMFAFNWRKDDCLAGQENNYRAVAVSDVTLGHIKTCLSPTA